MLKRKDNNYDIAKQIWGGGGVTVTPLAGLKNNRVPPRYNVYEGRPIQNSE